jgi:hypothetical protein
MSMTISSKEGYPLGAGAGGDSHSERDELSTLESGVVPKPLRIQDLNKNISLTRVSIFACLVALYLCISMAFYSGKKHNVVF